MDEFLYLETIGHRSGLPRTIEIWFVERDGRYYVVSGGRERAAWVRNIKANGAVAVSIGTGEARESVLAQRAARARLVVPGGDDDALIAAVSALMDAKYGWSNGLVVEIAPEG